MNYDYRRRFKCHKLSIHTRKITFVMNLSQSVKLCYTVTFLLLHDHEVATFQKIKG